MKVLDLFSGIGGFSRGLQRAGMTTTAFCEVDPFCRQVLAKHWPRVPILGDIQTAYFPEADVVVGGFPCQDVSCAGKRAGITGERSGLYRELVRALRVVRPKHAIVENVAALLGDGMGTVLGDMAESGFDLEWDCVPANAVGAPHERDRVWIVAHANGGHGRPGTGWEDGAQTGVCSRNGDSTNPDCQGRLQSSISWQEQRVWPEYNPSIVADSSCQQVGSSRQSRLDGSVGSNPANPESDGCRQGRSGRPPDSFARIRDEARRNIADPYGARLAFRAGLTRDAWEKLSSAERDRLSDGRQSIWPDEPALSGVDDGIPDWMDRIKATGNAVVPLIPQLIGETLGRSAAIKAVEAAGWAVARVEIGRDG